MACTDSTAITTAQKGSAIYWEYYEILSKLSQIKASQACPLIVIYNCMKEVWPVISHCSIDCPYSKAKWVTLHASV